MFGYVHISPERLNGEEKERYQACYCGLCHTLLRSQSLFHAGGTHGASHAQNREFLFKSHCGKVF